MRQIRLEETEKLSDILAEIQNSPDTEIEIIATGSKILDLPLNQKLLLLASEKFGKKVQIKDKKQEVEGKDQVSNSENLGFLEGRDIAQQASTEEKPVLPETAEEEIKPAKKKKGFLAKLSLLRRSKKFYITLGVALLALFLGAVGVFLLPSSQVTIFTKPQFQEAEFSLTASEAASSVDKDAGIIPLKTLDTTQEDSLEATATGTKTIGDPAKGRVTIINHDQKNKTFFKGTVITPVSGTKVQFTLDETATILASPVGCGASPAPACEETGVNVTAKIIGESGNLKSGTVFKVGDASTLEVSAVSSTNFSGGTSKKVKVVSQEDQKKLKEDLLKNLEEKAKDNIKQQDPGVEVPDGGLQNEVLEETYNKQIGEEADNFRLSMQVKFIAKTFSEDDLKELLLDQMKEKVPIDFELDEENISVSSEILDRGDQELKVLGKIKAALIPSLNKEEIKRNIAGRDFGGVDKYLKSLESVSGFDIKVSPLPFRIFGILPFVQSRIGIDVKQEE